MKTVNIKNAEAGRKVYYQNAEWQRKFLLWPRVCDLTGQLLWLKYAFRGVVVWNVANEVSWSDVRYADITEVGIRNITQNFGLDYRRD